MLAQSRASISEASAKGSRDLKLTGGAFLLRLHHTWQRISSRNMRHSLLSHCQPPKLITEPRRQTGLRKPCADESQDHRLPWLSRSQLQIIPSAGSLTLGWLTNSPYVRALLFDSTPSSLSQPCQLNLRLITCYMTPAIFIPRYMLCLLVTVAAKPAQAALHIPYMLKCFMCTKHQSRPATSTAATPPGWPR